MSNSEYCWMWEHCPYKSAACRASQPEDDGCYVYRRFKDIFKKQGLLKECPTVCGNNPKWCESCVSKGKCASTKPNCGTDMRGATDES